MLQLYGLQILLYSPVIKFGKSNKGFTNCSFVSWSCNSAYSNGYDFNGLSTRQQNWYIHMFIIVALSAVAEFIGGYLDYYPNKPIIHKIVTLSEFCTAPFITVVFVGACGVHKPARVMTGVMILHIIEELLAAHFGIIFYITPAGAYVRSAFYWIYIYIYIYIL